MEMTREPSWHVETWLCDGEVMHRAASKERLTVEDFEKQRKPNVKYVILKRVHGTYSDGKGARPAYEKIK